MEFRNLVRAEVTKEIMNAIRFYMKGDIESAYLLFFHTESSVISHKFANSESNFLDEMPDWLKAWRAAILEKDFSKLPTLPSLPSEFASQCQDLSITEDTPEKALSQIIDLYNDDKLGLAVKLLHESREKFQSAFIESPEITELENDYNEILSVFGFLEETEGWTKECSGQINVKYKNVKGTPTYSLLTEAEIDVPICNFITLVYETDLYHNWVPFCKRGYTVGKVSRSRKILVQEFDVTFVPKRHTCVYGYGANLLSSHGSIVIFSKSCDQEPTFKGISLPQISSTRANVNIMAFVVRPLSLSRIHVTMLSNYDPNMYYLPYKVLNFFSRKMAKGLFQKILKLAKNFEGSEYQKRISAEENREFYQHLQTSQEEYLRNLA